MDDLTGLNWESKPQNRSKQANYDSFSSLAALRPTPPVSGRSTPLNTLPAQSTSKSPAPTIDSFSNLVSFSGSAANKNLPLLEQQRRLKEQQQQRQTQVAAQYSGGDDIWNNLGSGRSTPGLPTDVTNGKASLSRAETEDEDDILAAFSSAAPVDSSTNFPKPNAQSPKPMQISQQGLQALRGQQPQLMLEDDDDDPFGLRNMRQTQKPSRDVSDAAGDDDDVLGMLGKPVSKALPVVSQAQLKSELSVSNSHPQDASIAELLDMGFSPEKARQALESTESGVDVQAAVGWLLNQAHVEASQQARSNQVSEDPMREYREKSRSAQRPRRSQEDRSLAWSRTERRNGSADRQRLEAIDSGEEKDAAQMAAELGTSFLKSANSLWKTGTKKMQQAVQELNSDSDSSQPRWMREPTEPKPRPSQTPADSKVPERRQRRRSSTTKKSTDVTDEAMMLESDQGRPQERKQPRPRQESRFDSSADTSRDHSPAVPSRLREHSLPQMDFLRSTTQPQPRPAASQPPPRTSLNRQALEEQASQAYVSSARRRKPAATPLVSASEPDLFDTGNTTKTLPSRSVATLPPRPVQPVVPVAVRPTPPKREIPPLAGISLRSCHSHRLAGMEHYKRGDYSAAHQSYSSALRDLPSTHPIAIVILTNRALTASKIGEPKSSVSDADTAMGIIGPSRGESEIIDLGNGEPPKSMRGFYGKALMRKAEAFEQLERWSEATASWKEAVERGYGGATSIQGRSRAEKAANSAKTQPPQVRKIPAGRSVANSLAPSRPIVSHAKSGQAVKQLRAANAAAEQADDERFRLADTVEARIQAWKGGKADNIRALLASLDTVLWDEAKVGWKKIGMAELVLPAKVKIQYMKGISKVHPDKVRMDICCTQRATTDMPHRYQSLRQLNRE